LARIVRIAAAMLPIFRRANSRQTRRLARLVIVWAFADRVVSAISTSNQSELRSMYVMSAALAASLCSGCGIDYATSRGSRPAREEYGQLAGATRPSSALAQAAALVPGTSRSGATILAMMCGLTRETAARFSFCSRFRRSCAAVLELVENAKHYWRTRTTRQNLLSRLSSPDSRLCDHSLAARVLRRRTFCFIVYR